MAAVSPDVDDGARLRLADRYIELGLSAAARALLERVARAAEQDRHRAAASRALSRLWLPLDAEVSLSHARRADEIDADASSALTLGESALAARQPVLSREAFSRAVRRAEDEQLAASRPATDLLAGERASSSSELLAGSRPAMDLVAGSRPPSGLLVAGRRPGDPRLLARALLGRATAAQQLGDSEAAIAALERFVELDPPPPALMDEAADVAAAAGLAEALAARVAALEPRSAARTLLRAHLLAAGGASARQVSDLLAAAAELPLARLSIALRLARRRGRDPQARSEATKLLETLAAEPDTALLAGGVSPTRVRLLLASIYDDDAELADVAARHYEDALAHLPRDAYACNNLGVIALRHGEGDDALRWLVRALEADPQHEKAYLNLARLLYVTGTPDRMVAVIEALQQAGLGARCLSNLCFALVEVAREDAHQGLASKGHQLKNLLGVVGARMRKLARSVADGGAADAEQLSRLSDRVTSLYDQWAVYLRTMREESHHSDSFDLNQVVADAARLAGGRVALRLGERLPEVYGMREQLLEALVNLVRNGQEAQRGLGAAAPPVSVTTTLNATATALQVTIEDRGPGIPPADLRRIFAPGYTTKRDGSGLGLAIAERVVRAHGGHLHIDSPAAGGTRVLLSVPVHLESEVQHQRRRLPLLSVVRSATPEEYVVEE